MIEVEDYHKAYDGVLAVQGLSFRVEPGQILGLVGPNGAGKTTTLRALAGIIPPTRGRLFIAGFELGYEDVEAKRRFAYVPDDPRLFEALTVDEHLQYTAAAYRLADWEGHADALLGQFDLLEKRDTAAGELSRGMRQKVAICCAWLHRPAAIVFDEPLTGLDPRAIRTLKDSIIDRANAGTAVVISSHLLALVEDLCSHLLIIDRGQARFNGPITELRKAYADLGEEASLEDIFFRATSPAPKSSTRRLQARVRLEAPTPSDDASGGEPASSPEPTPTGPATTEPADEPAPSYELGPDGEPIICLAEPLEDSDDTTDELSEPPEERPGESESHGTEPRREPAVEGGSDVTPAARAEDDRG